MILRAQQQRNSAPAPRVRRRPRNRPRSRPSRKEAVPAADLAAIEQDLGVPHLAKAGVSGGRAFSHPAAASSLALPGAPSSARRRSVFWHRPVRVLIDERGDLAEAAGAAAAADIIEPAHDLERQRVLALARLGVSLGSSRSHWLRQSRRGSGCRRASSERATQAIRGETGRKSRQRQRRNTRSKAGHSHSGQDAIPDIYGLTPQGAS